MDKLCYWSECVCFAPLQYAFICSSVSISVARNLLCSQSDAMFQVVKKLKEKEIKRQEHIYEFILTEKHHCLTLSVMQKVCNF
jgi:A-kinase anchor protein 13